MDLDGLGGGVVAGETAEHLVGRVHLRGAGAETDDHVDHRDLRCVGGVNGGAQTRQVRRVGVAGYDRLLDIHHEQGGVGHQDPLRVRDQLARNCRAWSDGEPGSAVPADRRSPG